MNYPPKQRWEQEVCGSLCMWTRNFHHSFRRHDDVLVRVRHDDAVPEDSWLELLCFMRRCQCKELCTLLDLCVSSFLCKERHDRLKKRAATTTPYRSRARAASRASWLRRADSSSFALLMCGTSWLPRWLHRSPQRRAHSWGSSPATC